MQVLANFMTDIGLSGGDILQTLIYLVVLGIWAGRVSERMKHVEKRIDQIGLQSDTRDDELQDNFDKTYQDIIAGRVREIADIKSAELECRTNQTRRYETLREKIEEMIEKLGMLGGKMDTMVQNGKNKGE